MDEFARQCSGFYQYEQTMIKRPINNYRYLVTVYVDRSFPCGEGGNIGGTVVPPATNNNFYVGHAIYFKLDTPRGWCNEDCLDSGANSYAKCFTDKVDADRVLVWGAQNNKPTYIDDDLVS